MEEYSTNKNISILLIEDNMGDAILIQEFLLESLRFRAGLTHCLTIDAAMQQLQTLAPDIILLDLSLPDAQDLDGLRKLRQYGILTPIIVLTGRKDEIALESLQSGAQDYLSKDMMMASAMLERSILYTLERSLFQSRIIEEEQQRAILQNQINHERLITSLINDIYHEFRNPLSVINASAAIMARSHPDERMLRHQHKIERNVARLLEIIEYMARMTRLSNIDTAGEWVTICDVFKDVEQKTRPLRAIDIDYTDTDYKTKMSAEQLFELLFLLLDNAMTFSAPDARISLTCRYNTANLLISIRDEGIGIASEDIDKILLPFYKVDNARTQIESTGAGLGLTIANMIVKTFDGSLTVLSELNVGTTVIVQLPIAEETHPEQENYHSSL